MTATRTEPEEHTTIVIDTDHGRLRVPRKLLALWDQHGWPDDDVLAALAADERWQP